MVFGVAEIVAFVSEAITLEPGDLIATGTPAGVGYTRAPPRFLAPGDEVSVEIERVGTLTNPVLADVTAEPAPLPSPPSAPEPRSSASD